MIIDKINRYLNEIERTEETAKFLFYKHLKQLYPDRIKGYHETFIKNIDKIKKEGIIGEDGKESAIFFTLGKPGGFITSKEKAVIEFEIPIRHLQEITYDMRYEGFKELLERDPNLIGADLCYVEYIPPQWITKINIIK